MLRALALHGRLTQELIRRLFFSRDGGLASVQAVWLRLRTLQQKGLVSRWRLPAEQGSGPFLYELTAAGGRLIGAPAKRHARTRWAAEHDLGVAGFYTALVEALRTSGGTLAAWLPPSEAGFETAVGPLSPDAAFNWQLARKEGWCFLEWDRGTESLAAFAKKLERYEQYFRARRSHAHLGTALRPRLLVVAEDSARAGRLLAYVARAAAARPHLPTTLVTTLRDVIDDPLGAVWRLPGRDGNAAMPFWGEKPAGTP